MGRDHREGLRGLSRSRSVGGERPHANVALVMPLLRKAGLSGLIGLIVGSALWSTALGHSTLIETEPPLGASLAETPETFRLIFDKPIEAELGTFTLRTDDGKTLRDLSVSLAEEGRIAVVDLGGSLEPGSYRLAWKAVSAGDGHVIEGIVPFAIGVATTGPTQQTTTPSNDPPLGRVVARWLELWALLLLVGSLVFPLIEEERDGATRGSPVLWGSLGVLLIAGGADVAYQTGTIGAASAFDVLTQSAWGQSRLAEYALALGIGGLALVGRRRWAIDWGARGLAGLMLLAHAWVGHNASQLGTPGLVVDWLHLSAGAVWLGGLVHLAWIWIPGRSKRSDREHLGLMRTVVPRFSAWALPSVLLLIGSGVYAAFGQVSTWGALVSTPYGQLLLVKSGLLLPVLGLAGYHRWRVVPSLLAQNDDRRQRDAIPARATLARFRRTLMTEAAIVVGILIFAGGLTLVSPPHAAASGPRLEPASFTQETDDYRVRLTVHPPDAADERRFDVTIRDAETGEPVDGVLRVWLRFDYLDADLGDVQQEPVAELTDGGGYTVAGPYLNLTGDWTVTVIVRIEGRIDDVEAEFHVTIRDEGKVSST